MTLLQLYSRRLCAALLAGAMLLALAGCSGGAAPGSTPASAPVSEPAATAPDLPLGGINVQPVDGLPEDFHRGVDLSSLPSELESGVVYYDLDGEPVTDVIGFCKLMAACGVTDVRVRVWNDPFDADGHGYGGGNCNALTAAALAEGCKQAGLHLLVDFHLSDFWADPSRQLAPKAWAGYTAEQKADAAAAFITETLEAIELVAPGVVTMVQVGNETVRGIAGEMNADGACKIFAAGCDAVKAFGESVGREVKRVIHLTDPQKGTMTDWGAVLDAHGVDYDVMATSYYPAFHGSLEELTAALSEMRTQFGKEVLVVETSYPYTFTDTDGTGDLVDEVRFDSSPDFHWSVSVQGQAVYLRDVAAAALAGGATGLFYWEPAWITVGDVTNGASYDDNAKLWEQYGSGWANRCAAVYDPENVGEWYGGSNMDTQAFFDAAGHPLASANIWNYLYTGCQNPDLPEEEWLEHEAAQGGGAGAQTVAGNLIPAAAASFDDGAAYTIDGAAISPIPNSEDPYEGENDLHWWSESENVRGTVTLADPITLAPGAYRASVMAQGYEGDLVQLQLLGADGAVLAESETYLTGWADWHELALDYAAEAETAVQVRLVIDTQIGGWGTCDLLALAPAA